MITSDVSDNSHDTSHSINRIQNKEESFSPYIQCWIEGEEIELLVDTGATVSVLTKEIVDVVIKKDPTIPQLPINGVRISNAVGKQICKILKQIFCRCQFSDAIFHANFIQVEGLNEKGIIGADILNQHNAQINFQNHTIQFEINKKPYSISFSKKLPKPISVDDNLREIAVTGHDEEDNTINISYEEQKQFNAVMRKYEHLFSDNPGRIKDFECQIRVIPGEPIYQKPYPIPISKAVKIDQEIGLIIFLANKPSNIICNLSFSKKDNLLGLK